MITNPLLNELAPDPFMVYDEVTEYYYSLHSEYSQIAIYRSKKAGDILRQGEKKVVYVGNFDDKTEYNLWAPEMHKAPDGKWYIYSSAMVKCDDPWCPRLFVLGCDGDDPFGKWSYLGQPLPTKNALDPTIYTAKDGKQYACYSLGHESLGQVLEIREMVNPYTFSDNSAVIANAEYDWELVPPYDINWAIVEGAFFVENKGRLFIIYSANGAWSDHYCLGLLEFKGGNLCDKNNWVKYDKPIFELANGVYAPGHASFFRSPDKSEWWIAYHGVEKHNEENVRVPRYMFIQKFNFDETGFPADNAPLGFGSKIPFPSGEKQ